MGDIIQLLPDSVANQIAAGEVIQRPASVVKELLENALDAGATSIDLVVHEAGKKSIQVIDNGCGMSDTDARMSLERHATSKIKAANDLFAIKTMGFRGEAMASIASIAHMEIKTKMRDKELGTRLVVEGTTVISQEPDAMPDGTQITVKNLFYNVPARRKFLKSDNVEFRHIIDEFERVALTNSEVKFTLLHNGNEIFRLPASGFRQRLVNIFGKSFNQKLVPVEEETNLVNLSGYVIKPDLSRKTRGEQFFFVNGRYVKSQAFHHSIVGAMSGLLPQGHHPGYFLHLEIDPASVDINIHPTKTEMKFEEEKSIYAILQSAVKQSLSQYNIAPSLDFDQEDAFNISVKPPSDLQAPGITINPNFNPFNETQSTPSAGNSSHSGGLAQKVQFEKPSTLGWEKAFEGLKDLTFDNEESGDLDETEDNHQQTSMTMSSAMNDGKEENPSGIQPYQVHGKYIISPVKSGLMIIHQSRAHERVLYEKYIQSLALRQGLSQQTLFPETIEFSAVDADIIRNLHADLQAIGFNINEFGQNSFVVQGLPDYAADHDPKELIEGVLELYKHSESEIKLDKTERFARSLAKKTAIKVGKKLTPQETQSLIDELFACEQPQKTPSGKTIVNMLTLNELDKRFD